MNAHPILIVLVILGILFAVLRLWTGSAPPPSDVGSGTLAPCPESPNCVSSQGSASSQTMPPIRHDLAPAVAHQRLLDLLTDHRHATVTVAEDAYIWAEFRVPVLGFVDDVEFVLADQIIHYRSASRLGHSDLGVNRRRMVALTAAFSAGQPATD